jgi:hypothetical protein
LFLELFEILHETVLKIEDGGEDYSWSLADGNVDLREPPGATVGDILNGYAHGIFLQKQARWPTNSG